MILVDCRYSEMYFPRFFFPLSFWRSKEWLDLRGALSAHAASAPYPCAQWQAQALSDVLVISLPGDSRLPGPRKTFEELIERGSVRALAFLAHRFFFCCSVFLSEVELSPRSLSSEVFIFSLSDEASPTRIRAGAPRSGRALVPARLWRAHPAGRRGLVEGPRGTGS